MSTTTVSEDTLRKRRQAMQAVSDEIKRSIVKDVVDISSVDYEPPWPTFGIYLEQAGDVDILLDQDDTSDIVKGLTPGIIHPCGVIKKIIKASTPNAGQMIVWG